MTDTQHDTPENTENTETVSLSAAGVRSTLDHHHRYDGDPTKCSCGWVAASGGERSVLVEAHVVDELLPALGQIAMDARSAERDAFVGRSLDALPSADQFDWILTDIGLVIAQHTLFVKPGGGGYTCSCTADLKTPEDASSHIQALASSTVVAHLAHASAIAAAAVSDDQRKMGRLDVARTIGAVVTGLAPNADPVQAVIDLVRVYGPLVGVPIDVVNAMTEAEVEVPDTDEPAEEDDRG